MKVWDRAKELLQKMYDEHMKGYQRELLLIKQSSVWAIEAHSWKIAFSFTVPVFFMFTVFLYALTKSA